MPYYRLADLDHRALADRREIYERPETTKLHLWARTGGGSNLRNCRLAIANCRLRIRLKSVVLRHDWLPRQTAF